MDSITIFVVVHINQGIELIPNDQDGQKHPKLKWSFVQNNLVISFFKNRKNPFITIIS